MPDEGENQISQSRPNFTNVAILRCTQNDRKSCKAAFTLAEVLITLGVIGVVAALTLPSIVANYKEKVLVTQVRKSYSELQNALKLYSVQNGCSDVSCIIDLNQTSTELAGKLFAQFQGAHKCPDSVRLRTSECKVVEVKHYRPLYVNGVTIASGRFTPAFVSASGTAYQVKQYSSCPRISESIVRDKDGYPVLDKDGNQKKVTNLVDSCALFYIDANGVEKGPNQLGADVYRFDMTTTGKLTNRYSESVLTEGKLQYTPYELNKPKK